MRGIFRLLGAIAVVIALLQATGSLGRAMAQTPIRQIELTQRHIEAFIAAQGKIAAAKHEAEFEAIAKEHGFAGLDEIDDVEANIVLLMSAIDPATRTFREPPVQIKRRIDEVTADASIPEAERRQVLQELTAALESAKPIQFPGNVELVKRNYDRLQAALE